MGEHPGWAVRELLWLGMHPHNATSDSGDAPPGRPIDSDLAAAGARRAEQRLAYGWVILFLTTFAQSSVSIVSQSMAPIAPFVQETFDLSRSQLAFLNIAMASGTYFTLVVSGRLIDRAGERIMLLACGVITGVFAVAMLTAQSFPMTLGIVALMSVGTSIATPAGSKAVMSWFAPRMRGTAMGIRQVGIPVGGMIAGLLLPPLAVAFGWRAALAIGGVLAILGTLVCCGFYRDAPSVESADPRRPDELQRHPPPPPALVDQPVRDRHDLRAVHLQPLHRGVRPRAPGLLARCGGALLALAQAVAIASRIFWGTLSDRAFRGDRKTPLAIIAAMAAAGSIGVSFLQPGVPCLARVRGNGKSRRERARLAGRVRDGRLRAGGPGRRGHGARPEPHRCAARPARSRRRSSATSPTRPARCQPSWLMLGAFVFLASLPIYAMRRITPLGIARSG